MGALINAARVAVRRVPNAKGNHRPRELAAGALGQPENESVWRIRGASLAEWDVELAATGQPDPARSLCFASLPVKLRVAALDFAARSLCLDASARARIKSLDLLPPLKGAELDRDGREASRGGASPRRQLESPPSVARNPLRSQVSFPAARPAQLQGLSAVRWSRRPRGPALPRTADRRFPRFRRVLDRAF